VSQPSLPTPDGPADAVAGLALDLARTGRAGLGAALAALVAATGLRSAVLHGPGPDAVVLAAVGERLQAVPVPAVLELPVHRPGSPGTVPVAVLVVTGSRPVLMPLLQSAVAVLGLALAAGAPELLDAVEHDRDQLADRLHDGALQDLLVARLAADAAVRGGSPVLAREAVQDALVGLRRLLWHVRPRAESDLPSALAALSARLVEAGGLPLRVLGVLPAPGLDRPVTTAAFRLVQAVAVDAARSDRAVTVALRPDPATPGAVVLDLDGGIALADPDRWQVRLRALGGDLHGTAGRLRVLLPLREAPASCSPTAPPALHVLPPTPVHPLPPPTPKATP